jgi:hypothetical protein
MRFVKAMLTSPERGYAWEALLMSLLIPVGFRTVGVPRTQHWLRGWAARSRDEEFSSAQAALSILHARRAQKLVHRNIGVAGTCLSRSLALWTMLLRRGVSVELRVGFRRQDGKVQGHAWVEHQGAPINEETTTTNTYASASEDVTFDALVSKKL